MYISKVIFLAIFFFFISMFVSKTSYAFSLQETFTSENSVVTRIQEGIEYFFAFRVENKVAVLEKQAEKRLAIAQGYANEGNNERVKNLIQNYLQIKEKQNNLLGNTSDKKVLNAVEERTVEQQKTMEEIKTKIGEGTKKEVVEAQEQVVNQVAEKIVEVKGTEGQTKFFQKVEHVWAPGTGPGGGESGVVYEGGGKLIFAPGTSAGSGNATSDIKTVEIKTGGTVKNDPLPVPDGPNYAPGTTGNSPGNTTGGSGTNTIDSGGLAPGTTLEGKNELAP